MKRTLVVLSVLVTAISLFSGADAEARHCRYRNQWRGGGVYSGYQTVNSGCQAAVNPNGTALTPAGSTMSGPPADQAAPPPTENVPAGTTAPANDPTPAQPAPAPGT